MQLVCSLCMPQCVLRPPFFKHLIISTPIKGFWAAGAFGSLSCVWRSHVAMESGVVEPSASVAGYSTAAIKTSDKKCKKKNPSENCTTANQFADHGIYQWTIALHCHTRPQEQCTDQSKIETYFGFPHDQGGGGKKLRALKKFVPPPHPPGVACAKKAIPP